VDRIEGRIWLTMLTSGKSDTVKAQRVDKLKQMSFEFSSEGHQGPDRPHKTVCK